VRVLHWSELFWPDVGGVEVFGGALLRALQERGHEFVAVCSPGSPDQPDEEVHGNVRIRRFPFRRAIEAGDAARVVEIERHVTWLKREFRPDVVHVHGIGPSVFFHLRTARAHPVRTLLAVVNELAGGGPAPDTLREHALRAADWIVCVAEELREQVLRRVPEVRGRCSVIRNAMPLPPLSPPAPPRVPPRLLCVGRLVPQKGFDLALTAFGGLAHRFPEVRLVVAGDGPARAALERQAAELGLGSRVEFAGWVEPHAVWDRIREASVVLMPSRIEGLPLVALQAARIGRPVVGTRVGGLPDVVRHGETGLIVEKEDPGALAGAVASLLEDAERASALGREARRRSADLPDWDSCVAAYDSLYRRLGASAAAPAD
jgi:glycogen(starch) synthase